MGESSHNVTVEEPTPLEYSLEEAFYVSKTGNYEDCEDAIYIGPHFVAVIDGATSKTSRRWGDQTGGRVAASSLRYAFAQVPQDATARQAVDFLTAALKKLYERHNLYQEMQEHPVQRAVASFVAVSVFRKEVWFVGDCQCLLDQHHISNVKKVDMITSQARSMFLETEIAQGKTIEELLEHDTGRAFILPLLEQQMNLQNKPSARQYWFPVIDGFDVPDEGIRICPLPADIETIVLASDGYPYLKSSLEESERALQEVLRDDPLLFHTYRSTKGVRNGGVSFDDRAYVRLKIKRAAPV